jgi:alkylation response protein AidB-like acyl-CoA dehydrogenase
MVQMLYFMRPDRGRTVAGMDPITKLAGEVADAAAPHADRHDIEGSFVTEGVEAARDLGYLAAPVPADLGGGGASTADICQAQRVIARACGSTGLACSMHLHVVRAAAWRWQRGDTVVEPMLRKVVDDRLVVVSTGGNDWTHPTAVATPVEGGWRVSGRKTFASLSPAGGALSTFAVVDEPAEGAEVLAFGCPMSSEGVRIEETWDAAGMRGTGSHDVVLEDVFVAEGQIMGRRSWGELDRPLLVASLHAWPIVYATYLGVAEGLVAAVLARGKAGAAKARSVGLLDAELRTARWALEGVLADLGPDPDPTMEHYVSVQQMKRIVTLACQEVATVAAEVAGGGAYARRGPVDRMIRDLRAAIYHPEVPEATLVRAGRTALGLDSA